MGASNEEEEINQLVSQSRVSLFLSINGLIKGGGGSLILKIEF